MSLWVYGFMSLWVYEFIGLWVYEFIGLWVYAYTHAPHFSAIWRLQSEV